jgi:PST family polysaccharide transporter
LIARFASNFIGLALVRGFAVLGPLIVMPYLVKTVGLENWGKISFALASTGFGGAIVQYGFSISATADIARARSDSAALEREWRTYFASSLFLGVSILLIGSAIIAALGDSQDMRVLLLGGLLFSVASALVPIWIFIGLERTTPIVISSFGTQVGYAALVLLLVDGPDEARWVTLLGSAAATAGLVIALAQLKLQFGLRIAVVERFRPILSKLKSGLPVFLMMFVPLLYNAGGILILGLTHGKTEVALLTVPATLVEAAILAGRILANAALAMVATEERRFRKFARYTMRLGIGIAVVVAALAPVLAHFLTPDHRTEVTIVMTLLSASIPFGFAQLVYGQNYLAISGHASAGSRIVVTSSIAGAILTAAVVPWTGAIGAAAVILASRALLGVRSHLWYRNTGNAAAIVPQPATVGFDSID